MAAVAIAGTRPWAVDKVSQTDATNWLEYTAPDWARSVVVRNEDVAGGAKLVRVASSGGTPADGVAFNSAHKYVELAAGASVAIPISAGRSKPTAKGRTILVAVSVNPTPISFTCSEAPTQ